MKVVLYARVSTHDKQQNPDNQLHPMREFCQDAGWDIFSEYVDYARAKDYSGRKQWQRLQSDARQRKFKTVLVFRLDRPFRSVKECVNCLEDWHDRGIAFKSLREDIIDTSTGQGRFILHIMAAVAELESSVIGDRVAAGMARAKAEGRQLGRKMLEIPVTNINDALQTHSSVTDAAKSLGCSRAYIHQELGKIGTTPRDVMNGTYKINGISASINTGSEDVSEDVFNDSCTDSKARPYNNKEMG